MKFSPPLKEQNMPCTLRFLNGPMEGFTASVDESGYARIGKVKDSLLPFHFDDKLPEGVAFSLYVIRNRVFLKEERGNYLKRHRGDEEFSSGKKSEWREVEKETIILFGRNVIGLLST